MSDIFKARQMLEQQEHLVLTPYAVFADQSRGRCHLEPEHQYRTCFQRDHDRIIHSAAFRRLEAKTQVYSDASSDYYRTRLTHTIEVAQIARTLARILRLNMDLAGAAALAHDLGHPPFGHKGEEVLNKLMADHGGFEHNRQSLRIVDYLEHPYPNFRGLNLTYETRECLAKHETRYDQTDPIEEFGPGRAPLEGQIANLSDAIAYNSHDLDDALAYELITEDDLHAVEIYQHLKQKVESQFPHTKRHVRQLRSAKALIDLLIQDVITETARRLSGSTPTNVDAVRQANSNIVAHSPHCYNQLSQLQDFLLERVYLHPSVISAQQEASEQVIFLFSFYLKNPDQLPDRYQQRTNEQGPHRVICDYIAGMTDRFCRELYRCYRQK
ncbi:MAG: deoxyguanosinetriphosphate triphosphohydrolase [Sedimentisphaerales bacterium]|nr:deoxyguanosinetriphosphate triphosphohydrolase [Sedimentisphaerales bacterium]